MINIGLIKLLRDKRLPADGGSRSVSFAESRSRSHCTCTNQYSGSGTGSRQTKTVTKKGKKQEISHLEELSQ
jgi:hypothetical protein